MILGAVSVVLLVGVIGPAVAVLAVIAGGWAVRHTGVANAWERATEACKEALALRENELEHLREIERHLRDTITEQQKTIARLEQLPNLERVLEIVATSMAKSDEQSQQRTIETLATLARLFDEHEKRSADYHDAAMRGFGALEARLTDGRS